MRQSSLDEANALATRFAEVVPIEFASSPLYAALGPAVARDPMLMETLASRRDTADSPNLLFAAIHYLVLDDPHHSLRDFYSSVVGEAVRDPAEVEPVVQDFCERHRADLARLLMSRFVQTNVVGRSAALRLAMSRISPSPTRVHLVEVGASSGIHLLHSGFRYRLGGQDFGNLTSPVVVDVEWRSDVPPSGLDRVPDLARCVGIDLNPIDPSSSDDRRWLRALVWPDEHRQADALEAALNMAASARPEVLAGDVIDCAAALMSALPSGEPRVVFHAATRVHVPAERRTDFDRAIASLGDDGPLQVVSLEPPEKGDPSPRSRPSRPYHVLKVCDVNSVSTLALVDGHASWIELVE